jgi:ribose transport system substrate-binding protein
MMRTLEGQCPKIQSVMVDPIELKYDAIEKALPADCSLDNDGWLSVGPANWGQDPKFLDQFFTKPVDPEAYKP